MSEIRVSDANESIAGEYLIERLPPWMPTHDASGNFKLLDTVGRAIDRLEDDITSADNATTVQHANKVAELEKLGRLVDLPPKQNESREKYRTRLISEFQLNTNEATIGEIINNVAEMLDVPPEKVHFSKEAHGTLTLSVPGDALENLAISSGEFVTIIGKLTAAGFNVDAFKRGTFTYITPTVYQDNGHTASRGYTGLDADGDPKDTGGTYAGLIE